MVLFLIKQRFFLKNIDRGLPLAPFTPRAPSNVLVAPLHGLHAKLCNWECNFYVLTGEGGRIQEFVLGGLETYSLYYIAPTALNPIIRGGRYNCFKEDKWGVQGAGRHTPLCWVAITVICYIVYTQNTQHPPFWTSDLLTFRPTAKLDLRQLFIFVLFEG